MNAMLKDAYAISVAQMKLQALADGFDPTLGIMHQDYREGPAYVLDLVEPEPRLSIEHCSASYRSKSCIRRISC